MLTVTLLAMAIAADNPPFKFTTKREDDRVTAKTEKDRTLFDITSPTGISEVVIERTGDAWPETVVIRLHTSGLEQFRAKSEKLTLSGSVASHTDYGVSLGVDKKKEDPADPKSAYFMDFKKIGKDGKPATEIPLKGGYFEMRLPKPFFEGNPKSVTLTWIDFFRR
ncbi:Putative secreted protein OS=Rhodopirellula europaea 6C GN=RE6C_04582 PE=4 SV=1 [Gemmata massiliana]|uniref:Uncharacterized protein n=1 Tax=Gemmata massiliana TaxID=1210884 RepID=A0A6P2CRA4_9BACT|nr:hypothetical protein [Gemmata massiliana]VTR91598.1 Putative secreted protein OS=Rhodopirellula europaea 6C GN=RE6C_04582 PE=4 SV=1 [Gemmata massiliana]